MTENHNYSTPSEGTLNWDIPLNSNFGRVDTDLENRDTEDSLQNYSPVDGAKFLAIDTGTRYIGDGSQWVKIPAHQNRLIAPTRTSDPNEPSTGQLWFRTDTDVLMIQTASGPVKLPAVEPENGPESGDWLWKLDFAGLAPEASKSPNNRNLDQLKNELENRGWDAHINNWVDDNLFYNDTHSTDNNYSLEFRFPEDERMGFDIRKLIGLDEAWVQYYLKFEDGFDVTDNDFASWADGGKLPGWQLTSDPSATDGSKAWMTFHDPDRVGLTSHDRSGKIHMNYYVEDQNASSPGTDEWDDDAVLNSGEWYEMTLYAKMNDVGSSNGHLKGWVNGTKMFDSSGYEFRSYSSTKINWAHISHFGGGWYSPQTQSIYTDNVRAYDTNPL